MRPRWAVDKGWTGDWSLPPILKQPISDADRERLLALSCSGMGPGRLARELARVDTVAEVADAWEERWSPARRMARVAEIGARVIVPSDDEYPARLGEISAPPPLLYVRGERLDDLEPCVAIVGSRACTRGGRAFAARLGAGLADAGIAVVSGLARGIDGAGHSGALETGRTIAVLGTGIERIYPAEHRELAERVVDAGALVTEFPPGTTPKQWHFPARNRIISGLSIAVIVVEAREGSGALITASFALEQGRDVLACITGPENPSGAGLREMLRDGAQLIVDAEDAVEDLVHHARTQGFDLPDPASALASGVPELEGDGRRLFELISEGTSTDELAELTRLPMPKVAAALSLLELEGVVERDAAGGWWRTTR